MRQLTFTIVLCFLSGFTLHSNAQVTLTKSNFLQHEGTFTYEAYQGTTSSIPSEGPNQVWDYSGLATTNSYALTTRGVNDDPNFPDAQYAEGHFLSFQSFSIPRLSYTKVDESGEHNLGYKTIDKSYSIAEITQGANDMLRFPPTARPLEGGIEDVLQFPTNYQDQWTNNYIRSLDFELSVASFGLNNTPGLYKQYITSTYEVSGYGQLIIPTEDGSPSAPIEVLLVKATETRIDSIFLEGVPDPSFLINAFGTTQGATNAKTDYSFYTPGFQKRVLLIDPNISLYQYIPAAARTQGEIIITQENFPREASFISESYVTQNTPVVTPPSTGLGLIWDYSDIGPGERRENQYFDASNDPVFPDALSYSEEFSSFQQFQIRSLDYIDVDEKGYTQVGDITIDTTHSLANITGSPNHTIRFPADTVYIRTPENRNDFLQFPAHYGSEWNKEDINASFFELTIPEFGLNQTLGFQQRHFEFTREIVGEGQLIIPLEDGTPSNPIDVLLLKSTSIEIDSFFVGGSPANEVLLNAFQVVQGQTNMSVFYTFYTPNFGNDVLFFTEGGTFYRYRPEAAAITSTEPINISHNRVCDVPTEGQSQVTVVITGGVAPYQVSGNFNGEVAEGEVFSFIMQDGETNYEISVVDATGSETQVLEDVLPCTKLPVELLIFEGEVMKEGNFLQWTTASELNNQFFTLSYSIDGQNFVALQKIEGNGTTSTSNTYNFLHRNAPTGTTYYQLTQTDLDGTSRDLGVVSLQRGESRLSSIEVYPTATTHQLNVAYTFANESNRATLKIYDMMGRMVKNQVLNTPHTSALAVNVHTLTTGTYIIRIENELEVLSKKFVKH